MTKAKSTYDKLFEKYFDNDITKSGTKYELLAGVLLKNLIANGKVIHDIKLIGKSTVKHQIDVLYESDSKKERILIECKDFDISKKKVGLGIVRDFSAVVTDIKPDKSFIITCNGFTREAKKFAKFNKITLSVLREYTDKDNEGRILKIIHRINIVDKSSPEVETVIDETHNEKLQNDLKLEQIDSSHISKDIAFYVNTPTGRFKLLEYVETIWQEHSTVEEGNVILKHKMTNSTIEVANRGGVPILGIILYFNVKIHTEVNSIVSDKIAELIMQSDTEDEYILYDKDIKRFEIDETGEIKNCG